MKKILFILFCSIVGLCNASAQSKVDSVKVLIKIKELKQTEITLKKRIETEDKKRNQNIEGVSEVSMNAINERQDSICLELRSQVVDTCLQIRELELSLNPVTEFTTEQSCSKSPSGLNYFTSSGKQ